MSEHQVYPYLEDGKLKTRSSSNKLPAELISLIKQHKQDLIDYLKTVSTEKVSNIQRQSDDYSELQLSFNQERLWLTNQIGEGSAQYNISTALKLSGELNIAAFQYAFDQIITRHEVLRTQFFDNNGECGLKLAQRSDVPINIIDLSHYSDIEQTQKVNALSKREAEQPFNLEHDLMLRVTLLKLTQDQHILLFTLHHIASDGWSIGILVKEFVALYTAHLQQQPSPLPDNQLRYVDFAHWQRDKLSGDNLERALDFWKNKLNNIPKLHNLPLDNLRPAQQTYTGSRISTRLDASLTQQLNKLAEANGCTLFMVLQCAYALLIAKYSGDNDVVIGSPVAGRTHQSTESLIGFFANALAYRNQIFEDDDFQSMLMRCKQYSTEVFEYQDMPFSLLVKELENSRSLAYSPIFQLSFTMQNNERSELKLDNLAIDYVPVSQSKTLFDLSLFATEMDGEIVCEWLYYDQIFNSDTIKQLGTSFTTLLTQVVAQPQQKLATINLADSATLTLNKALTHNVDQPIHHLFEQQAVATPNATALYMEADEEEHTLSYDELNQEANKLAHYLLSKGVGSENIVGICVERSMEMIIAVLGVLKAGAAYLPLDPSIPAERLAFMVEDAQVTTLVTQQTLMSAIDADIETTVLVDKNWRDMLFKAQPITNPMLPVAPNHLAYVIYTSGSTGTPKGVMIEHRSLVNNAFAQQHAYDISAKSNLLQFVSFSFDVATSDWASALTCGAQLTILSEQQRLQTDTFAAIATRTNATHLQLPAAMLSQLPATAFPTLTTLILGGSQVASALLSPWHQRGCKIINAYGPTETTVASSAAVITPNSVISNIGGALPNLGYWVVDTHNQPLQAGSVGELLIAGVGLARGYLNQPDLTAEKFVSLEVNQHGVHGSASAIRFYRTGDLVKWCDDGSCEFVGRIDDQVKIRGFRIELGEVEAALGALDGVKEVAVLAVKNDVSESLAAYFVANEPVAEADMVATLNRWRAQAENTLPDYMIPSAMMILPEFPLTVNGKVDKKSLPEIDMSANIAADYIAPSNDVERHLCDIWQSLLQVERVGVSDNFFALGGDSIISIQVVARAKQQGIAITTRLLFEHQTIAELAPHAEQVASEMTEQQAVVGEQTLLPIQHQFLQLAETNHAHFNQSVLLIAPEKLNQANSLQILTAIYQRHDVLRLILNFNDNAQNNHTAMPSLNYQELTDQLIAQSFIEHQLSDENFAEQVATICNDVQTSFSLTTGPLFKIVLMHSETQRRVLLLAHHLVVDGVSWRILLSDIERAYQQIMDHEAVQLAAKTTSYQTWGEQLNQLAQSEEIKATQDYWQQQMQQAESLPKDFTADKAYRRSSQTVPVTFTNAQTTRLLTQCQSLYSTKVNELLLAGVLIGLQRWSGNSSFNIEQEGHGREDIASELDVTETVGWFTTTYPMYLSVADNDVGEIIIACKEHCRNVPDNGLSFGLLRYLSNELTTTEQSHSNSIAFNYLGQFDQSVNNDSEFKPAQEFAGDNISRDSLRNYHLGLNGKIVNNTLHFNLDFSTEEYQLSTMEALAEHIQQGISAVIEHCAQTAAQDAIRTIYTPSDFPLAKVSQETLNLWQSDHQISKLYPATPMQKGMLYHSLLDSSAYVSQAMPTLRGRVDLSLFRQAWQHVVAQFDIFRTAFVGQGDDIHQLVVEHAEMDWYEEDLRHLSQAQQQRHVTEYQQSDRRKGFDFLTAPLQRISVFWLEDDCYQLLWSHHHALLDGWCSPIVYQHVITAYQTLLAGQPLTSASVPVYQHYIEWLHQQNPNAAQQFWGEYLDGVEQATDLSILKPGAAKASEQKMAAFQFSAEQTAALKTLASQYSTTVNTVLQLAWGYLLHRYSDDDTVVFGTPVSGRPPEVDGIEEMVGLFINTVPVKVDFKGQHNVGEMLQTLHTAFQACNAYGFLPLTDIQQQSAVTQGQSLFSSMLIFENYPLDTAANEQAERNATPFTIEKYESYEGAAYAMAMSASLREQLSLKLYYDSAVLAEDGAQRVIEHFKQILRGLAAETSLPNINVMSAAEQANLAQARSQITPYPDNLCLHQLFEQTVVQYSQHTALVHGHEEISYDQLNRYANQLARWLIEQGVQPETKVALLLDRSADSFIALLAILKAGAAYVPIDMSNPVARIEHILAESDSRLVISAFAPEQALTEQVSKTRPMHTISRHMYAHYDDSNVATAVMVNNLAYIIFTSGSTGLPKGVMVEHQGLVNLVCNDVKRFEITPQSKLLHCTSMGFDAGTAHMFKTLCGGGALHIVEPHSALETYIEDQQITHLALPVARLEMMHQCQLSSLKVLITGAEAVSEALVSKWAHQCKFFNVYGPTEITIAATTAVLNPEQPVTIGQANANTYLYVLDSQQREVPNLVAGELYIGGVGVSRGYINQPALTATQFIDNPFGHPHAPVLYRTGDLVRRLPNGDLDFICRIDKQVKIRGFRIELGEIKAKIQHHVDVREAHVSVQGEGADKRLVCHYSTESKMPLSMVEMKLFLTERLPEYMVPTVFEYMEQMPLTPNGKIDVRALPEPQMTLEANYVAPSSEIELQIADIWRNCLSMDSVGVCSNFFELGGNSLQLSKILYEVNQAFDVQLDLKQLFEAATIAEMALLIESLAISIDEDAATNSEMEEGVL